MLASKDHLSTMMLVMENEPNSIQSQGGKARAQKLPAGERKAIAAKAAMARWGAVAIKKGNFQKEFGIDVDCYVLNDVNKTAVISQSGMGRALGMAASGKAFPRFLETKAMSETVGAELRDKLSQPVKFQLSAAGGELPSTTAYGFDVTLLIDVCRAILEAEPKLGPRQENIVSQAHVIVNASAKSGIKGLVYALAGYNPSAEEVIAAFKHYVQEEAKRYEKEFPPELYIEWHRLYEIPVHGRGKPWHFKHLTLNHIYIPLAQSNGKVLELMRVAKTKDGDRRKKLFQFLSEVGARALSRHLGRVLEMAESSASRHDYERKVVERFGGQQVFDLTIPQPPEEPA